MPSFRIKGVTDTDETPIFSLTKDAGDLALSVEFSDGRKEVLLYLDEDGVNRRYLHDSVIAERLENAGFRMDCDRIIDC